MASFTDKTPTFNPYVSQQPIDAMVKVGMMKQQKYDTNLQKIQQSMSEIAGLQIGRDIDKEYLEKKVSEVNSKLRIFAAGDFSNNNLTTSMRGMIGGIANDEIIQNSVRSTMAAQSAKQLQSKFNSEGKGSPSNDWLLGTQLEEWYNNPEVGASFSGTYKPYQDYKKKTLSIIKELTGDETITESAFSYDKNNKLVLSDAITRRKVAGLTPEKVQEALMASLTPSDWEQISIDGRYTYSNIQDSEVMKQKLITRNEIQLNKTNLIIKELEEARELTNNIEDINYYDEKIEYLQSSIERERESFSKSLEGINEGNLEQIKAQIYTQDFLRSSSEAFSYKKQEVSYKTNPFAEREWARERARVADAKWNSEFKWNVNKFWAKFKQDQDVIDAKADGGDGVRVGGREETTIANELLPDANILTLNKIIFDLDVQKKSIIAATGLPEHKFLSKYKMFSNDNKLISEIDPLYKAAIINYDEQERLSKAYNDAKISIYDAAESRFGDINNFISAEDKASIYEYINSETGETVIVNNSDILFFIQNRQDLEDKYGYSNISVREGTQTSSNPFDAEKAKEELSPAIFALLQARQIKNKFDAVGAVIEKGFIRDISDATERYQDEYFNDNEFKKLVREKREFINDQIGNRLPVGNAVQFNLEFDKVDKRKEYWSDLTSSITELLSKTGGLPGAEGLTKNKFIDFIGKSGPLNVNIKYGFYGGSGILPDRSYFVILTNALGEIKRIPLPESIVASKNISQFEETSVETFENNIITQILISNGKTIGSTGKGTKTDGSNAVYNNNKFPNIKKYNVTANVYRVGDGTYSIRLNIIDPISGKEISDLPYPRTGTVVGHKLEEAFLSLNDEKISLLINIDN